MIEIDQTKASEMTGKVVLAGVSFCAPDGRVLDDQQYFGTVLRINAEEGLVIASGIDGSEINLPPYLEQYSPADPGTYKLKSIDRVVTDPDYISTWRVYPPANGDAP
ncbi:hypothetical protein [[Pseudomonas] boreopolis]|uniref:hypothetical protein n=1 Tax=Xanthomonas boreopolis TaxID=86183 RepID=UPI003D9ADE02